MANSERDWEVASKLLNQAIRFEIAKAESSFEAMSGEEQREYLKEHPKSAHHKDKLKPLSDDTPDADETEIDEAPDDLEPEPPEEKKERYSFLRKHAKDLFDEFIANTDLDGILNSIKEHKEAKTEEKKEKSRSEIQQAIRETNMRMSGVKAQLETSISNLKEENNQKNRDFVKYLKDTILADTQLLKKLNGELAKA